MRDIQTNNYHTINERIADIKTQINTNIDADLDIKLLSLISKDGVSVDYQDVYIDSKGDSIIEDTIVFRDIDMYSSRQKAKEIYLKRDIAKRLNDAIEKYEIRVVKSEILAMQLTNDQKNKRLRKADELSTAFFRSYKNYLYNYIIESVGSIDNIDLIDVDHIMDDTTDENIDRNDIYIANGIDPARQNMITQIYGRIVADVVNNRDTVIMPAIRAFVGGNPTNEGGEEEEDPTSNNSVPIPEVDPTKHTIVDLMVAPGITVGSPGDFAPFESTSFMKYFKSMDHVGLLTYHMLCYFPNIIFMVYAFAKYVENRGDVLENYQRSYPGMSIDALKDYTKMFFERDFSDELNIVFTDADVPMYGDNDAEKKEKMESYKVYDNVTAFFIHIADGILNKIGLFKYSNAGLAAELGLFATNLLKGGSTMVFDYIQEKTDKYTIGSSFDVLYCVEEYVCETHGPLRGENSILMFEKFVANNVYVDPAKIVVEAVAEAVTENVEAAINVKEAEEAKVDETEPATYQVELYNIPVKTPARAGPDMTSNMGLGKYAPMKAANSEDPTLSGLTSNFAEKLQPRQLFANEPGAQTAGRRSPKGEPGSANAGRRGKTRAAGRSRCAPRHTRKRGKRRSPFGEPGPANAGRRGNTPKK
jgi:hypothetical protein